ncbi:MAG TPA: DNA mismatch repair endonuclease MutL [Deltaproteobacteria bacterium]|nr:DNA mismatch repair endonuclease MutL [Deltaproteobacteria bacterium]
MTSKAIMSYHHSVLQCNKIKIMPESLAIKISAGEVVERPASVVKELVENSIDAKATDISVYIHDGGRKLIRVIDNGEGMTRDDAVVAFERHATSKLLKEEDLYSIHTMGFRGEALPSIASVSEIVLTTKITGEITGSMVKVKGGIIEEVRDAGCADGTTVEARDIFFNTPARLKFMRSVATETGHIADTITRLALAYPAIRFRLFNNGSAMLKSSVKADLRIRIADVFGRDFLKDIIPLEAGNGVLNIHGFIAMPETAYSTTKGLFIYVNNRWIRDRGINHAITNGYRNVLGQGKYPLVVLFITIAPQNVDVNVHPTKCEVRFKSPKSVYELVSRAIEAVLAPSHVSFLKSYERKVLTAEVREGAVNYNNASHNSSAVPLIDEGIEGGLQASQQGLEETVAYTKELFFRELEVIGQLWQEYLLCEREGEFYIIDQHAAAERSAFEKLKGDYYLNRRVSSQLLLLPQKIELSLQEKEAIESSMEAITDLGFDIEPFGGNTFIVRAVPEILSGIDCRGLIKELLDDLVSSEMSFRIEGRLDAILMRIACHSVIRGKRILSHEERKALVIRLSQVDFAGNCPHGRPVIKAISKFEIEKMFKRR